MSDDTLGVCAGIFLSWLVRMSPLKAALREKNRPPYVSAKSACFAAFSLLWKLESLFKKNSRGTSTPMNNPT